MFGKGWSRRVAAVQRAGCNLATGSVPPEASFIAGAQVKARITDAKPVPQTATPDAAATGGGITATLTQANDAIAPLADKSDAIAMAVTVLTIIGVLVTVGGLVWGIYARKRRAELHDALDLVPASPVPAMPVAASDAREEAA